MEGTMGTSMQFVSTVQGFPQQPVSDVEGKASSHYGLAIIDNCGACRLRSRGFFCSLSAESIRDLDRIKHASSYPEGAVVFVEGQNARGVYIVCQGRAKLMTTNKDGRTFILKIA